jgi:16S rRNA (guanine527-N7)-methyltransferase
MASPAVRSRLAELVERHELPPAAPERFAALLDLVAAAPVSITAVRDPAEGVDAHVADSLVALDLEPVRTGSHAADLGSGGGFPGLALAIARPDAQFALVESVQRKCAFLERAVAELGLTNVIVVNTRAEEWREGLGAHDLVAARAVAPLPVLVEYAAPLLEVGGALVAWKGRRDPVEEADGTGAAAALAMDAPVAVPVEPFVGATNRHLYVSLKVDSTPNGYPRRTGMARKRPIAASGGG